jgi:hypothetical protein
MDTLVQSLSLNHLSEYTPLLLKMKIGKQIQGKKNYLNIHFNSFLKKKKFKRFVANMLILQKNLLLLNKQKL